MKERLTTLGAALLALLVTVLLLGQPGVGEEPPVSRPVSSERGAQGLVGLKRWLEVGGVPTLSLQERYLALMANPELKERGNLLILSLPETLDSQLQEREALAGWLAQGNSVLILAAMSDWPEWARLGNPRSVLNLIHELGFTFAGAELQTEQEAAGGEEAGGDSDQHEKTVEGEEAGADSNQQEKTVESEEAGADSDQQGEAASLAAGLAEALERSQSETRRLLPAGAHPLLAGIGEVQGEWKYTETLHWNLEGQVSLRSARVLLRDAADGEPAFWLARVGEGRLYVSRHADLFGNVSLGRADNARLMGNIVAHALGPEGRVIFDDMHQGITRLYDPQAFFGDPRLHHTMLFLLALWLIYAVGHTNRFVPLSSRLQSYSLSRDIHAIGGLLARRLHKAAVARRLLFHFNNEVRAAHGLPQNGQPVWQLLAESARLEPSLTAGLRHAAAKAEEGKRVDLIKLTNAINCIRKGLT